MRESTYCLATKVSDLAPSFKHQGGVQAREAQSLKWRLFSDLCVVVGAGTAYWCAAFIALHFFATAQHPAAIWISSGLALAVLLLARPGLWPAILVAFLVAGAAGNFAAGKPLVFSVGLGVADAVEALLSASMLVYWCGKHCNFTRLRHFAGLVFLSAILANGIGAVAGAAVFHFAGHTPFFRSWWMWFLSNGIGIVVVTPCVVSVAYLHEHPLTLTRGRLLEAALVIVGLGVVAVSVFGHISMALLVLPYSLFPFLIWSALRFGVPGASMAALILAVIAVWETTKGLGPFAFASGTMTERLLQVQSFVGAALACSLVPATVITERKETERRLRQSETRLAQAQEIAGLGSFVLAAGEPKGTWSEQMFRLTGRDRERGEPTIEEYMECVHPDDRASFRQSMIDVFEKHESFNLDFRFISADNSVRYLHALGRPIVDENTRSVRMLGTVMDMTDRRRIEEDLRQAQKMEAVGRLAGGVAHDFNNLLGIILGYAELALATVSDDDPVRAKIEPISKAASRAASLTGQLLAFSRKQVLKPQLLNLNTVVSDLAKMLRRIIGEQIELVLDLSPFLPVVKADPGQIEQVVLNLAVNAKDAMPDGGRLVIRTSELRVSRPDGTRPVHLPVGKYAVLTVSDTGHGMDEFTKAHIFEPFFTTKEKHKGTGLGLATVYGIVSQSKGYVWVESASSAGATFYVCLPGMEQQLEDAGRADSSAAARVRSETVLLVEDEPPLRELIRDVLVTMGCTVLEARSGEEAIRIARRNDCHIDVLLTDVIMPGMNGFELTRRIADVRPSLKVLYMSGYSDELIVKHDQTGRRPNFIQKPFKPEELRDKLHELSGAGSPGKG
jgi:signal transduction histidine kinase/integral membrane sensor domain MASE1/CheY-like chemotaxis protein